MRRNRQSARLVDHVTDVVRRFAFEIRQGRADAEQVPFRSRYFDAGDD